jgi:hypothetical protein
MGRGPDSYFTGEANQLYTEGSKYGSLAVLTWLGYSPPDNEVEAALRNPHPGVAPQLVEIVKFLKTRGKIVSVIGHSWTGQILSDALFEAGRAAVGPTPTLPDNAIFVGAMGHHDALLPGLGNTRVWWACNSRDATCAGEDDPPPGMREFGSACEGCNVWRHSYFNTGSVALCNMAHIVTGRYAQVDGPKCQGTG